MISPDINSPTQLPNLGVSDPLNFKLNQILESGLGDDDQLTQAWECLEETLIKENETDSVELPSKPLKTILESQSLTLFQDYVDRLSKLDQCLDEIETIVNDSKQKIESIETQLEPIRDPIYQLYDTIQGYENQQSMYLNQIEISKNFLNKFTLSMEDKNILTNLEEEEKIQLDWNFFKALHRLESIQSDSLDLLVKEGHMVGQDIVNALVEYKEIAYERLDKWLKDQVQVLQSGYPEVSLKCKWGIQVSRNQPGLFQDIINIIVDIRSKFLLANFFQSLTKGGRPIDYNASDSLRYIGDILAWVHSAVVEEKDLLFALLCISLPEADSPNNEAMTLPEGLSFSYYPEGDGLSIVDHTLQDVLHPIFSKIRDTLEQLDHPMISFQITNLIQFYTNLLLKLLGPASVTAEVFEGLVKDSIDSFFKISQDEMTQMIAESQSPDQDLSVETNIRSILIDIKKILQLNETSVNQVQDKIHTVEKIVQVLLHPLLEFCEQQASFVNESEQSIYLINCFIYIQSNLKDIEPIDNHIRAIEEAIKSHEYRLIEYQFNAWLQLSGLDKLDDLRVESKIPTEEEIQTSISKFNQFLYTIDIEQDDPLGLNRLSSSQLVRRLRSESTKQFIELYVKLYDFMTDYLKQHPSTNSNQVQLRSVTEIETLLWIDSNNE